MYTSPEKEKSEKGRECLFAPKYRQASGIMAEGVNAASGATCPLQPQGHGRQQP